MVLPNNPRKSEPGPPMTLGNAAAAQVRLIIWCKDCRHQVEPDPAEMAARYGAETPVADWRERLVCSKCGSREIDINEVETLENLRRAAEMGDVAAQFNLASMYIDGHTVQTNEAQAVTWLRRAAENGHARPK
jgi:hypothetical protein